MPKLKSFRQLSRRQRNRRLKKIQNYEYFITEDIEDLRQNDIYSEIDDKNSNNSFNFITDQLVVHNNNPNNICINTENQPTITDVSTFSAEEYHHCISFPTKKTLLGKN